MHIYQKQNHGFRRNILQFFQPTWRLFGESVKVLVTQPCPTLCNAVDCSLPGSSVHGILQARILERVATPFSRGSSQLRDQTQVSCIADRFFTVWATREAHLLGTALH